MAVREMPELGEGQYEVMDGNHRREALARMGMTTVRVESFGAISKAEAILIARRRNHNWFADNPVQLAQLMRHDVLPDIPVAEMVTFMPETQEELEATLSMADNFSFEEGVDEQVIDEEKESASDWGVTSRFSMPHEVFDTFMECYKLVEAQLKDMRAKPLHKKKDIAFGQVIEAMMGEYLGTAWAHARAELDLIEKGGDSDAEPDHN